MASSQPSTPSDATRILIACVGNIFLGDDGFGVEVARALASRRYPPGVEVVDFGIRGVELAYTLLDGCDTLILVDAVPRGGSPGDVYLIEPGALPTQAAPSALDAHSLDPLRTLAFAQRLGARPRRTLLVGCEPSSPPVEADDPALSMGLSPPVQAAIGEAVKLIDELVARLTLTPPLPVGEAAEG